MSLPLVLNQYGAIIAPGASLSSSYTLLASGAAAASPAITGGVALGADTLVGIWMPATWVTAALTFQVSPDGGTTWVELFNDSGSAISITAAASQFISLVTNSNYTWRGINMLKVRSGTSGSPVVQTGGATVTLIGRPEIF
jgi:hypothetical protein